MHIAAVIEGTGARSGNLIASFPRSGSTLTWMFLAEVVRHNAGDRGATVPPFLSVVPALSPKIAEPDEALPGVPVLFRTHDPCYIADRKTAFLFRLPGDAIHSFFAKRMRRSGIGDEAAFYRSAIREWQALAVAALRKHDVMPEAIRFFPYEKYLAEPVSEQTRLLAFLGIDYGRSVATLVDRMNAQFRRKAVATTDHF